MTDRSALVPNDPVEHGQHGRGRIVADLGATVVVRFGNELHQLPAETLDVVPSLDRSLPQGRCGDPTEVLLRAQGLAISSVNDQWGVFSRSRIQLLPHQLWVCRVVNAQWPFRWMIADDVGLGKTIEAGLILMPLIASARVRAAPHSDASQSRRPVAVPIAGHVRHSVAELCVPSRHGSLRLLGNRIHGGGVLSHAPQRTARSPSAAP